MTLYECLCQCSSMCNDLAQHVAKIWTMGKAQLSCRLMIMQGNMTMKDKSYEHEEWWKLHGNISRNGYGNAIIGRYGGCFEEDIMRLMYERAYHTNDLDAPTKFAPTLKMRKGNARYRRSYQYIRIGGSAKNRILALVKKNPSTYYRYFAVYSREHKQSSTLRGVYVGLVILAHPRPMIREGTHLEPRKD